MLVVLASKWDEQAAELDRSCDDVRLLTPHDLSVEGWVFRPSFPESGVMVADGECIPTKEITGVFTRLPCVMPHELLRMVPEERDYAAAEMHAFLVAWLSTLRCPVVNRPTPGHLAGPAWGRERWISEAAKQGIPVVEFDRDSASDSPLCAPDSVITVVGKDIFGANDPSLGAYATQLANIAKVTALTVYFEKANVQFASCSIDLGNEAVKRALFSHFGMRCSEHDDTVVGVAR
jgi:hypothetical protein